MIILKTNPPLQAELPFKLLNKLLMKRGEERVSLTSLLPALSMVVEGTPLALPLTSNVTLTQLSTCLNSTVLTCKTNLTTHAQSGVGIE